MAFRVEPQTSRINNCLTLELFSEKGEIPRELFIKILALLDARNLTACGTLNRQWNKELKENEIWLDLFHKNYPKDELEEIKDLRKSYLDKHVLHTNYKSGICSIEYIRCHNGAGVSSFAVADKKLFSSSEWVSGDEKICVWNIGSKQCVAKYRPNSSCGISLAVVDKTIFSGSRNNNEIVGIDMQSGKTCKLIGHSGAVLCLASAERTAEGGAKAKVLFSGSADQTIRCWDLNAFQSLSTLTGHTGIISCFAISDRLLFSGSEDGTIDELITMFKSGDSQKADMRLFCLPQFFKTQIYTELLKLHPKKKPKEKRLESAWNYSTPLQKAQAIENFRLQLLGLSI